MTKPENDEIRRLIDDIYKIKIGGLILLLLVGLLFIFLYFMLTVFKPSVQDMNKAPATNRPINR